MSELEEKIGAVLSDPEQLSRLTRMASRLMGAAPEPAPEEQSEPAGGGLGGVIKKLMGKAASGGPSRADAVAPYLDRERRTRLEKALRLASTARMAGEALEEMGGLDGL